MEGEAKIKQIITLLEELYDENREGFWETGNYGNTFEQGLDCGKISACLDLLREEIK